MKPESSQFDLLIAGAGASGLLLALEIIDQPQLSDQQILLIDPQFQKGNDRTWCFWEEEDHALSTIVYHSWSQMRFNAPTLSRSESIQRMPYQMIRGIDFYNYAYRRLQQSEQVSWLQGKVEEVQDAVDHDRVSVTVGGLTYAGRWLFNSIPARQEAYREADYFLWQHFQGWTIRTDPSAFDPDRATLMDFRTPQKEGCNFMYVLPFSDREALIESTFFSDRRHPDQHFKDRLTHYCEQQLGITKYEIVETESGAIPMTDFVFQRKAGPRTVNIGTAGGQVKPTTGYAFQNMRRDAAQIAHTLATQGHPHYVPAKKARYRFYDRLLLHILDQMPEDSPRIFTRLFRKNRFETILQFLDEDTPLLREALLLASLPWKPFLRALYEQHLSVSTAKMPPRTAPAVLIPKKTAR